jgi:hypothetical protein
LRTLKIGFDFNGVFVNDRLLKARGAQLLFGLCIPPKLFKRKHVVGSGMLTDRDYSNLLHAIYTHEKLGEDMFPVEGMLETIPRILAAGHQAVIISNRGDREADIARRWLNMRGVEINLVGVPMNASKAEAAAGLDVFVDDDLEKLEKLVEVVPCRFLFSWDYNRNQTTDGIACRVAGWKELGDRIDALAQD